MPKQLIPDATTTLSELLEIKVDKQQLDPSNIFSDMASIGRPRLMGATLKRFLAQVLYHDRGACEALRQRYSSWAHQMFGDPAKDKQ